MSRGGTSSWTSCSSSSCSSNSSSYFGTKTSTGRTRSGSRFQSGYRRKACTIRRAPGRPWCRWGVPEKPFVLPSRRGWGRRRPRTGSPGHGNTSKRGGAYRARQPTPPKSVVLLIDGISHRLLRFRFTTKVLVSPMTTLPTSLLAGHDGDQPHPNRVQCTPVSKLRGCSPRRHTPGDVPASNDWTKTRDPRLYACLKATDTLVGVAVHEVGPGPLVPGGPLVVRPTLPVGPDPAHHGSSQGRVVWQMEGAGRGVAPLRVECH